MLTGLKNFLEIIYNNWTTICVVIGLVIGLYQKVMKLFRKNKENKLELDREALAREIEVAKEHVREAMLKMITTAETDFENWNKAGEIKRSQVIKQVFDEYPILSKAVDQEALIAWIDEQIDESLKTLRKVVEINRETE